MTHERMLTIQLYATRLLVANIYLGMGIYIFVKASTPVDFLLLAGLVYLFIRCGLPVFADKP